MPRKKPEIKPVYPIFHEAHESVHTALLRGGLLTSVEFALDNPETMKLPAVLDKIREAAAELRKAMYGDQ